MSTETSTTTKKWLAVAEYLRTVAEFERASSEFNEACNQMRGTLTPGERFVFKHRHGNLYLVRVDKDLSFDVDPIDVI